MREKSRIEGMRIAFRKRSVIFGEEQSEQRAGLQGMVLAPTTTARPLPGRLRLRGSKRFTPSTCWG